MATGVHTSTCMYGYRYERCTDMGTSVARIWVRALHGYGYGVAQIWVRALHGYEYGHGRVTLL